MMDEDLPEDQELAGEDDNLLSDEDELKDEDEDLDGELAGNGMHIENEYDDSAF